MNAFITGIAGFAGVHLAEHLLTHGDVVSGSSLSGAWSAGPEVPDPIRQQVPQVAWDISAPTTAAVERAVAELAPQVIYHLAAISKAEDCGREEPTPLATAVNIEGTRRVLELAARLPSRPRVVVLSSSYVYGPAHEPHQFVSETTPPQPIGGYAQSKLASEAIAQTLVAQGVVDAVIVRAFQHAGPRQEPRFMLAEWCAQFADRQRAPIKVRSWNSYIDLSDVRDVVRAYRLLAVHGKAGEIYNVGSGRGERSGAIFAELRAQFDPQRAYETDRQAPPRFTPVADIAKIGAATGWKPEISLAETMRDTYAWFAR